MRHNVKKGFTLIELLVVIAVIAVLMGILMPALSKVRKQAKGLLCKTQMKDIGTMLSLYMPDNDDRIVSNAYSGGVRWFGRLGEYYKRHNPNVKSKRYSTDVFYCPIEWKKRLRWEAEESAARPNMGFHYGLNSLLTDGGTDTNLKNRFSKNTTWKTPATLPLLHDESSECTEEELFGPVKAMYPGPTLLKFGWNGGKNNPRNLMTYVRGPAASHGRGINYLFGDMHVDMTLWPYKDTMSNPEKPEYYWRNWHALRDLSVKWYP